ncbi:MAG TPA: 50S ribosomal protein L18 [Burkholderiales bacterium]|nr:50S ribosomal protein L18 [Burkholderiales bacterium]
MDDKKQSRLRRSRKTRAKIHELRMMRLTVHRTSNHIYAQVVNEGKVVATASTLEPEVRKKVKYGGNVKAASVIGKRIAEKARKQGIESVAFDRSGFKYHGRVKALADAARENGLKF